MIAGIGTCTLTNTILILLFPQSSMALTQVSSNRCAGGFQKVFEHER